MREYQVGDIVELRRDLPDQILDYYSRFGGEMGDTFRVKSVASLAVVYGRYGYAVKARMNKTNSSLYLAVDDIELSYVEFLKKVLE